MFLFGNTAGSIEGINLPDIQHVNGIELKRNGHGVRSINFLGMDMKVYVAGFYSKVPFSSPEEVMASQDDPMQLDFTFLRSVGRGRVISAWTQQMEYSVSYKYDGYERDRDDFIEKFASPISNGGTQTVKMIGDDTVIVDQGVDKGTIHGRDFQKAFLSMWFGERAVAEDLKSGLLHGASQN